MTAILVIVLATATASGEGGEPTARPAPSVPLAPAPAPRVPDLMPAPQPGADVPPLSPPDLKRWYGWELILSDAAFVTLASRSHWGGAGTIGAALGITIGTPLLHAINGNGDAWRFSTIGRSMVWVAAFFAALGTAALSGPGGGQGKNDGPAVVGTAALVVGGGLFVLIDDFCLAKRPGPPDPARRVALTSSSAPARFVPALLPASGGATMGLGGVF